MRANTLKSKLKSFANNAKGSMAVSLGIMSTAIILSIGASIDVARMVLMRSQLRAALDSAALSAAVTPALSKAQREKNATDMLKRNLASSGFDLGNLQVKFEIENDIFKSWAGGQMQTSLMGLAGIDELEISASVEAKIAEVKSAEIALVLDYSGSMRDRVGGVVKYEAMSKAASQLVSDMEAIDKSKIKFGLVPFSHHVHVNLPSSFVVGATGTSWEGCTQDRPFPANLNGEVSTRVDANKWGHPFAPEHAAQGCEGYKPNNLTVMPLTKDLTAIKSKLASMRPYAWTHIALGVEFGYHLLSPGAPFEAAEYNKDDIQKFMVVLTDGMQTEPAFGPNGRRTVAQGEANLEQLCKNAKADGITMITIAYDLDDTSTRRRLSNCSSGSKYFYVAEDTEALASAFNEIKALVLTQVYLSK